TLSVLKGFFGVVSGDPVSYVNAPQMAEEHGIVVRPSQSTTPKDYVNLITVRCGEHAVAGTLAGFNPVAKIVMIDDFTVDIRPAEHMVVVRNDDVPGMIGLVGTSVGEAGVNIADMVVGQDADGVSALMVIVTDTAVPDDLIAGLAAKENVRSVIRVRG
ncbi:MAG TPA: phosphoglycerate dehydrogenase, partial [Microthrixaceae bacterium]|nr:phosphoglycerate dehydrogenase [Microthrixaceae bacterium]